MTNEQIVARIQTGENAGEHMAQLYEQVKRFIHAAAWRYKDSGMLEDLEQEGFLALYDAVDGYNADQDVKFLTYAEYWIRQRISRYLQMNGSSLRLPAHCREKLQQYNRFCSSFKMQHGREPSDREAAGHLSVTRDQIRGIRQTACMTRVGSLDTPVKGLDGGADTTVGDLVPAPGNLEGDAVDQMESTQLGAVLWECVDSLPGQQPEVIRQRYQDGQTLAEIGRRQGTTPEAVRQIHAKALQELRGGRCSKRLRPFLPETERIYSIAISGNGVGKFHRTWTSSTEKAALWLEEQEERRREHSELPEKYIKDVCPHKK